MMIEVPIDGVNILPSLWNDVATYLSHTHTPMTENTIHPVDRHVGQLIRRRRKSLRMSQSDLADQLGISFQQIQKYERAANRISSSTLHRVALILNVPIAYFFDSLPGGAEKAPSVPESDFCQLLGTPEGREVAETFPRIPSATVRRRIMELTRTLAQQHD